MAYLFMIVFAVKMVMLLLIVGPSTRWATTEIQVFYLFQGFLVSQCGPQAGIWDESTRWANIELLVKQPFLGCLGHTT